MRIFARTVLALALLHAVATAPDACAAGFGAVRLGATASLISEPFPSLGAVGIEATFLDLARVEAGISVGQTVLGALIGVTTYTYGASARLRVPSLRLSPTVGLGASRSYTNENNNLFHSKGHLGKRSHYYLNPSVGIELKLTDDGFIGGGLSVPFRKEQDGAWRAQSVGKVAPFFYIGMHFI